MDLKAMLNDQHQADKSKSDPTAAAAAATAARVPAAALPGSLYTSPSPSQSQSRLPHFEDRAQFPHAHSVSTTSPSEPQSGEGRSGAGGYFSSASSPASQLPASHATYGSRHVSSPSPSTVATALPFTPGAVFPPPANPVVAPAPPPQSHLPLSQGHQHPPMQQRPSTHEGPGATATATATANGGPLPQHHQQHQQHPQQQHPQQQQQHDDYAHFPHHPHYYHQNQQPHQEHPHHYQPQQQQQQSPQQSHQQIQPHQHLQLHHSSPPPQSQSQSQSLHHLSPAATPSAYPPVPTTPLGPPPQLQRASTQAPPPPSSGYEGLHRTSTSSVGSVQSRDYNSTPAVALATAPIRESSMSRPPPGEDAGPPREVDGDLYRRVDRAGSIESVSPKTIPRPPPVRHSASGLSQSSSPAGSAVARSSAPPPPPPPPPQALPLYQQATTPAHHPATPLDGRPEYLQTPRSSHSSSLPPPPSPLVKKEAVVADGTGGLKRNASFASSTPPSAMPAKKRLKREGVPTWARSARGGGCKSIRFDSRPPDVSLASRPERERPVKHELHGSGIKAETAEQPMRVNGGQALAQAGQGHAAPAPAPAAPAAPAPKWEESITNKIPHEDLIKHVCDWIYLQIGHRQPPPGAVFEIEAKIGNIIDTREHARIRLPIASEAVFEREAYWNPTKFESTMDVNQHRHLNSFLNDLTQASFREAHTTNPSRDCIRAAHTVEVDEFLELSAQGVRELGPAFHDYAPPNGRPWKVRRTINKRTGEQVASIIKTRMADLEVFCPNCAFDYRISVNVEANWQGNAAHLIPLAAAAGSNALEHDRAKDRVSYRHLAYQIDLTQISHSHSDRKEHELEVEISVDEMRREIDKLLRAQRGEIEGDGGERYERLVRGFINNVRVLCREGSRV